MLKGFQRKLLERIMNYIEGNEIGWRNDGSRRPTNNLWMVGGPGRLVSVGFLSYGFLYGRVYVTKLSIFLMLYNIRTRIASMYAYR